MQQVRPEPQELLVLEEQAGRSAQFELQSLSSTVLLGPLPLPLEPAQRLVRERPPSQGRLPPPEQLLPRA